MSHFQYFLPDVKAATPEALEACGLSALISKGEKSNAIARAISRITHTGGRGVSNGPGGFNGVIIGHQTEGYYPDRQKWVPAPAGDRDKPAYWIGIPTDSMPTPETLKRDDMLPGKAITFRDGSTWVVPSLCQWQEGQDIPAVWTTTLPLMVDIDRYGAAIDGPVVPEYRDLFDVGLKLLARMVSDGSDADSSITNSTFMQFASDVLGCNYRVSLFELSTQVMDCLSTEDAMKVVTQAIDWEGYLESLGNWAGRQGRPDTSTESGSAA